MKKYQEGGMAESKTPMGVSGKGWKEAGYPSEDDYIRAQEAEIDRKMADAMDMYNEKRYSGKAKPTPRPEPRLAKGGKVSYGKSGMKAGGKVRGCGIKARGCGIAKKGVRKAKML